MFEKKVLENGLRILTIPKKETDVITLLALFRIGSRFESDNIAGISHLIEHMFYKGTKKRPTVLEISRELDGIGAEENAFTSKEFTGYYIRFLHQHFDKALDILSDMLHNSVFNPMEIKKEQNVIVQEIDMHEDRPMQKTMRMFEECLYDNNSLGRDIAGDKKSVKSICRSDIQDFVNRNYKNDNAVVCVAGHINNEDEIIKKIQQKLDFKNKGREDKFQPVKLSQKELKIKSKIQKTEQTHLGLGFPAYSTNDPKKYIVKVLSTVLGSDTIVGGSMSSRLFTEIRGKRSLAYYVGTESQEYLDTGYIYIQAGISHNKVNKTIKIILKEIDKLKNKKVSEEELKKAKEFIKGRMYLGLDDNFVQAEFYSLQELLENEIKTPEQISSLIDSINADDIKKVANELFTDINLNLTIIGPHKNEDKIKQILKF